MKKLYSFVVIALIAMLGFVSYAQDVLTGVYMINGTFYSFVAASDENPRNEAINVEAGTYDYAYGEMRFADDQNPFNLKGLNADNSVYVYLNDQPVANSESGILANIFDAQVTLAANDVVKVYDAEPFWSKVDIGYMQTDVPNGAVNITMDGITPVVNDINNVLQGTRFEITAGTSRIAHVYVNNDEIEAVDGVYTFNATTPGDMLVIIDIENPQTAMTFINGEFYTFSAQSDANNRIEPFAFGYDTYNNVYSEFTFFEANNPFNIKGQNQNNSIYVYLNDQPVANSESGVLANIFDAQVTFAAADVLKIYDAEPFTANVKIDFVQARGEVAGNVTAVIDRINTLDLYDAAAITVLQGTEIVISPKSAPIYKLTVNGEVLEAVDGVYTITAATAGDINVLIDMLQIEDAMAYINGDFYYLTAQSAANNRVEPISIERGKYDGDYRSFSFASQYNPYDIKGMNEDREIYVYLNNEEVANSEAGVMANIYDARVSFAAGDVVKFYDHEPFTANLAVTLAQGTQVADKVVVTVDEITKLTDLSAACTVLEGTKITIAPAAHAQIAGVTINGVAIEAQDGIYTVYATEAGDMQVNIDVVTNVSAMAYVEGEFNVINLASAANNRIEPLSIYGATGEGFYRAFSFSLVNNPFVLKAQNTNQEYYVYLNNEEVANSQSGTLSNIFDAELTLAADDVLKIYGAEPYWTDIEIAGNCPAAELASQVAITVDHITAVADANVGSVLKGTVIEITAAEGGEIAGVTYCGEDVVAIDGVYTITADREGDAKIVINLATKETAVVMINGAYNTCSAASAANNRDRAFDFGRGTYNHEYVTFDFSSESNPYDIKAQNEAHTYYVYINDQEVENSTSGILANIFDAQVSFAAGDVVKIYDAEPFTTSLTIGFTTARAEAASMVVVTFDGITDVDDLDADKAYNVLEGTKIEIAAADGAEIKSVTYCGAAVESVDGVYTVYADRDGDAAIEINVDDLTGINAIDTDKLNGTNDVYNLQGIRVLRNATPEQIRNLNSGVYIINGGKVVRF